MYSDYSLMISRLLVVHMMTLFSFGTSWILLLPIPWKTDEEEAREGGEASGRDPPQQVLHRHSSEEPDSPTADDVNFSLT